MNRAELAIGVLMNVDLWLGVKEIYPAEGPAMDEREANTWKVDKALRVVRKYLSDFTDGEKEEAYKQFLEWNGGKH